MTNKSRVMAPAQQSIDEAVEAATLTTAVYQGSCANGKLRLAADNFMNDGMNQLEDDRDHGGAKRTWTVRSLVSHCIRTQRGERLLGPVRFDLTFSIREPDSGSI